MDNCREFSQKSYDISEAKNPIKAIINFVKKVGISILQILSLLPLA
jgi:hypothetical protein